MFIFYKVVVLLLSRGNRWSVNPIDGTVALVLSLVLSALKITVTENPSLKYFRTFYAQKKRGTIFLEETL